LRCYGDRKEPCFWLPSTGFMSSMQMDPELAKQLFFEGATPQWLIPESAADCGVSCYCHRHPEASLCSRM
ncbi:RIKEN cDNA 0610011L14, isoform CRA_b, partial [Mus musculus]